MKIIKGIGNINCLDEFNNTPLIYAVKNLDYNKVKILLENNAKINLLNLKGQTVFDILKSKNNYEDNLEAIKIETLLKEYE